MKLSTKILTTLVTSMFVLTFFVSSAAAISVCNEATIDSVGVYPDQPNKFRVALTCTDAQPAWSGSRTFYLTSGADGLGESGYATILMAVSMNKKIKATLAAPAWNSLLLQVFMATN